VLATSNKYVLAFCRAPAGMGISGAWADFDAVAVFAAVAGRQEPVLRRPWRPPGQRRAARAGRRRRRGFAPFARRRDRCRRRGRSPSRSSILASVARPDPRRGRHGPQRHHREPCDQRRYIGIFKDTPRLIPVANCKLFSANSESAIWLSPASRTAVCFAIRSAWNNTPSTVDVRISMTFSAELRDPDQLHVVGGQTRWLRRGIHIAV